jgi:hypothetical protein
MTFKMAPELEENFATKNHVKKQVQKSHFKNNDKIGIYESF